MSFNKPLKFKIPILDEEDAQENDKSMDSGSLFLAHRQEIKNNILSMSPTKSLTNQENANKDKIELPRKSSSVVSEKSKINENGETTLQQSAVSSYKSQVLQKTQESIQPAPGSPVKASSKAGLLTVSSRQRGNPVLKFVRNVAWEYGDIIPDYEMGKASCALFLSLRYHNLNPQYIHERLKQLGRSYDLRVLLVQVDVKEPHHALKELAKICILSDVTLIVAFSAEEVGRYLETYKAYENKPPDLIMEKTDTNFLSQFTDCMTSTRKVNKTDAMTLLTTFSSFQKLVDVEEEDLSLCPGLGPQKAKRLYEVLNEPFLKVNKRSKETTKSKDVKSDHNPGP